ncbi:MAG: serine protease AprX [Patiriisocius sp.]|jgi:serine protease AprX
MDWNKIVRNVLLIFVLGCSLYVQGQIAPNKYWVSFTDKENNTFELSDPTAFLTERSVQRRINQNIPLDLKDLPVTLSYINQVDALVDVEILYASKWFNAVAIYCETSNIEEVLLDLPFVGMVKNVLGQKGDDFDMNPKEEVQHITSRLPVIDYGLSFNQIDMLNGIPLHDAGFEGQGMRIGVIDAGFRSVDQLLAFEGLFDENRIIATKDFVDGDVNVYEEEVSTHGMFVLSTMAGILPDSAYGTATQAEYLLLRSEDTDSELRVEEHNWVAAAEYADSLGVDILTTSLGYTTFDVEGMNYTYEDLDGDTGVLTQASDIAASRGILVLNSAGNSGSNDWHYIGVAADGDSVLAIGAVNPEEIHASFSSFGPTPDGRIKPNVMAQGRNAVLCDFDNTPRTGNGTSFSCPIMAGMTACLWQMHPSATNMEIFHAIEESAHLFVTPNDSMGYGIPDFWAANLILDELLNVEDIIDVNLVTLYPNPVQGELFLEFFLKNNMDFEIEIFDAKGSRLFSKSYVGRTGLQALEFNLQGYINGHYSLIVNGDKIYLQENFVITNL